MTTPLHRELIGETVDADVALTVLTWNVLADRLAFDNFIRAPNECLEWPARGERILDELGRGLSVPADVLCLQEVDHHDFLAERLAARGYAAAHAPKAEGRDGCSLFVLRDRFALEEVETLRYEYPMTQFGRFVPVGLEEVETLRYKHPQAGAPMTQLALLGKLVPVGGGSPVRVATTHLKAKPGNEALRGVQAKQLAERCAEFEEPVVIAGDFNDVPGSPAHAAMAGAFESAYARVLVMEPAWTTWKIRETGEKKAAIDYVWCSSGLTPTACLAIPADADVDEGRLPSWQYPSDHLSLVACFARS